MTRSAKWIAVLVVLAVAPVAMADTIGPNCASCNGGIYTLSFNPTPISSTATTQTFQITLTIDTSGVNGVVPSAAGINAVAIKISSSVSAASLFSAPSGVASWTLVPGGVNSSGCSGSGSGFECADWIASGPGVAIGGILTWTFDMTIPTGSLFLGPELPSIKAQYVDENGNKVGSLVSEHVALPEPGTFALFGAGLLALAVLRRRMA